MTLILLSVLYPREMKTYYLQNKQTNKLPISFIHDISNLEITQISINNYVDKRIV